LLNCKETVCELPLSRCRIQIRNKIDELSESFAFNHYDGKKPLISHYDVYQHLMDDWPRRAGPMRT